MSLFNKFYALLCALAVCVFIAAPEEIQIDTDGASHTVVEPEQTMVRVVALNGKGEEFNLPKTATVGDLVEAVKTKFKITNGIPVTLIHGTERLDPLTVLSELGPNLELSMIKGPGVWAGIYDPVTMVRNCGDYSLTCQTKAPDGAISEYCLYNSELGMPDDFLRTAEACSGGLLMVEVPIKVPGYCLWIFLDSEGIEFNIDTGTRGENGPSRLFSELFGVDLDQIGSAKVPMSPYDLMRKLQTFLHKQASKAA